MNETKLLTSMELFDINLLVRDKIKYYEDLRQEWTGDKDEDFDMDIWCEQRINELNQIKNKLR
tara:strand:+ start:1238 stop:1426 length:189 start_codon:yes stop_codon:yes gene_type:complete